MMNKIYARVQDGILAEILYPATDEKGNDIPIEKRFTPEFIDTLVDVSDLSPLPPTGYIYEDGVFVPPKPAASI